LDDRRVESRQVTGFVYEDNGGRFSARGKGVGRPGPDEDGEKMLLS